MVPAAEAAAISQTPGSRYLSERNEIREIFLGFRDQRARLNLRFQSPRAAFTANILDVTEEDVLIEDIQPRSGLKLLRDGHQFSLSGRSEGQYLLADDNRVHRAEAERGLPYFHMKIPESVLYQQRRKQTRVALPKSVRTHGARLVLHRTDPLIGEIIDLSAGGCLARIDGLPQPAIRQDEHIAACDLQIRDQMELQSDVCVRHYSFDRDNNALLCGMEFTTMTVTDRRRLEQFVASCDRGERL